LWCFSRVTVFASRLAYLRATRKPLPANNLSAQSQDMPDTAGKRQQVRPRQLTDAPDKPGLVNRPHLVANRNGTLPR